MTELAAVRVAVFAFVVLWAAPSAAHFVLEAPPAVFEQNGVGDPQLTGPCGDSGAAVATGIVTPFASGETIDITINETITHPGHYRVAIALDGAELPPPPLVTPASGGLCGTAVIQDPPVFPILADGVLEHTTALGAPQTFSVTLPDVTCERCTLQVIEFASHRDPPCFHYHCAEIRLPEPGAAAGGAAAIAALVLVGRPRRRAARP